MSAGAVPRDGTVAVIGTGTMGCGIAQVASRAGHPVLLFDTRLGVAEKARATIAQTLNGLATKGKLDKGAADAAASRIVAVHALGDCVSAQLVIEAIIEDFAEKRSLLRELEKIVTPSTILASNTSSLSITALSAGLKFPNRVAGMHFFNPVPLMQLVEVVTGLATDAATADSIAATAVDWGKQPVRATSTPGFIVNRCARPFYGEALRVLAERAADAATIDALLREAGGFRMGAFELMDLIGNDVNFAVTRSIFDACYHDPRYAPSVLQEERVAAGYFGRKSGRGFFDYADDAARPAPTTVSPQTAPKRLTVRGDLGVARALLERLAKAGVAVEPGGARDEFPDGAIEVGDAVLALSDGRTATARAVTTGVRNLVLFDLALDYAACTRVAMARADSCAAIAFDGAAGALQAAGIAVSPLDDVAGLVVLRTVASLANEAADAVTHGVASARDVDVAMRNGVNYPRGPLRWADEIGVARVRNALVNLAAHYGEDRYRLSPLIARRHAVGAPLTDSAA
ncbi:MAG: 3-hydroxyacyl-CoA dehydrogenase PaaC [Pseudomonadota bacterium]|nr:3-hydroxyacyl-CoA dehydrogenase PaaC [Pseudomonadota bacterium]